MPSTAQDDKHYGPCGREQHICAWNDDAVGVRVERLAKQINEELATCCSATRARDIAKMAVRIVQPK